MNQDHHLDIHDRHRFRSPRHHASGSGSRDLRPIERDLRPID